MFLKKPINILARNTITKSLAFAFAAKQELRPFDLIYGVNTVEAAFQANRR